MGIGVNQTCIFFYGCSVEITTTVLMRNLEQSRTKQNKTEQNRTKQNKTEQNRTKQDKTEQNRTKQNKTEQSKQNKIE